MNIHDKSFLSANALVKVGYKLSDEEKKTPKCTLNDPQIVKSMELFNIAYVINDVVVKLLQPTDVKRMLKLEQL